MASASVGFGMVSCQSSTGVCEVAIAESLIEDLRRCKREISIIPNEASAERLAGAVLVQCHETWMTGKR